MDGDGFDWRLWNELLHGMAWEQLGDPDSAAVRYRRAADPSFHTIPFLTLERVYLPLVLQRLAAAERRRGDPAAAARADARLRRLWEHADAGLPIPRAEPDGVP